MRSRSRQKIIFWALIAACLLWGSGVILALPTQPSDTNSATVVISEFLTNNGGALLDEDGDPSDWIELYNRSSRAVDLTDWSLTDDPTQPDKWVFRSTLIPPRSYLLVMASGKNVRRMQPEEGEQYLHTNFKLASEGGFLALYPPTSRRYTDASVFEYPAQALDISYGRHPVSTDGGSVSGDAFYFAQPTPGAANEAGEAWRGVLEPVTIDAPRGFYDAPISVTIRAQQEDVEIRYTLDGSEPGAEHGLLYSGPITIERTTPLRAAAFRPGYRRSPVTTHTYLFIEDIVAQPSDPAGFPPTWGRHFITFGGYNAGEARQADYEMDPAITQDAIYGPLLRESLLSLPSISLVTEIDNLDIYANPRDRGRAAERPVSVEWIEPSGSGNETDGTGEAGFQIDAGLRIQGGAGRWEFMPKHPFRLFFRQEYGAATLKYPVFPDSPVAEFNTLVLRAGVDESFAAHPPAPDNLTDPRQATYARDEWVRRSQIDASISLHGMSHVSSHGAGHAGVGVHGRYVHLYINGLYWGVYNMTERPDAAFAASYFGGDRDDWFVANHGGAVGGRIDRFTVLMQLAEVGGLEDPAKYATFLEFIDPEQFADYLLVNWYAGNTDWPANNWYVNVRNPAGRNLFWVWDAEKTWEEGATIFLGPDAEEGAPYPNVVKLVFRALLASPDFRLTLADRLYALTKEGGALSDEASLTRWREITGEIERAIIAESARWGDSRTDAAGGSPATQADWRQAVENVAQQIPGNGVKLIALARGEGYYPMIDPPAFSHDNKPSEGGPFEGSVKLEMRGSQGDIYYTTDGSDPRVAGSGEIAPAAEAYRQPVAITTTTTIRARLLHDGEWSALNEAMYYPAGLEANVYFSEVMYNPLDDEQAEFLELHNGGTLPADLSRATITGVEYRFPEGTVLPPGGYLVLVREFGNFRDRYPEAEIAGEYEGRLSDKGEQITLTAADGTLLDAFEYDDDSGWPLSADGIGDSVVREESALEAGEPGDSVASWRASANIYGSPGEDDGVRVPVNRE